MSSSLGEMVKVVMPKMGVSIAEGTVVEWLVSVGERVEADQTLCEISTDKTDVEVPAPAAGVVERILVEPGATVPTGTSLAELGPADADGSINEADRSGFYSPVVRRIASSEGVDLAGVEGHGIGGRVRKQDLLDHLADRDSAGAPSSPETAGDEAPVLHSDSPYVPDSKPAPGADPGPAAERWHPPATAPAAPFSEPAERRVAMDPMRKTIAAHMVESRRTSAHCTTIVEADFSAVERAQAATRELTSRRGVSPTYLAYAAVATVRALDRHPVLNCSIEGEELVYHDEVNLGIAIAVDDGLVVPVIASAQRLSVEGMAAAIADLASRARDGALRPGEVGGGTFTITNPGRFGAMLATPIINQPEVAILDLEAVVRRPVVIGSGAEEAIGIRPMSYLCMSWDHRALDGVAAARFLADVRAGLEAWGRR